MAFEYPDLPEYFPDHPKLLRKIINVVRGIMQGKTNNCHSVTLTAGAASTVVTLNDGDLGISTIIHFMPTTANAAAEIGAGTMFVNPSLYDVLNKQFTITHANNAQADRTFLFSLHG